MKKEFILRSFNNFGKLIFPIIVLLFMAAVFGYNPLDVLPASPPAGKWGFGLTADLHTPVSPHNEYLTKLSIFQSTLIERKIQLLLNGGDIVNWASMGSDVAEWAKFIELWQENRSKIAHFTTPGNHCIYGDNSKETDFDKYLAISGFPGQTKEKMDYYFDFGNVRFISINASGFIYKNGQYVWDNPIDNIRITELQNYLDGLFNSAIGKIDHLVLFQHIGVYAPSHRYSDGSIEKLKVMYDYLANKYLNEKYFTITWFHGHDHMFYRTFRHKMPFIEVPSGGANGTWTYSSNFLDAYNSDRARLNLIDGDVWGEGEQCFIEGEVDGKTIEFRVVAFNDNTTDRPNPHYPPQYVPSYPKGAILNSIKLTVGAAIIDNAKDSKDFNDILSYPNPFNSEYYIPLGILGIRGQDADIKVRVYTLSGKVVREMITRDTDKSVYWGARDNFGRRVSSGIYFYEVIVGNKTQGLNKIFGYLRDSQYNNFVIS